MTARRLGAAAAGLAVAACSLLGCASRPPDGAAADAAWGVSTSSAATFAGSPAGTPASSAAASAAIPTGRTEADVWQQLAEGTAPPEPTGGAGTGASGGAAGRERQDARPTGVRIPSIAVDAPLEALRIDAGGVLPPPRAWEAAGWHVDGPVPGDVGPAVIAGHVDSRHGAAVFARLAELDVGDRVEVPRSDGRVARFRVVGKTRHAKAEFPTEEVYGATPGRELRLITCGGAFDRAWGHYLDNVVVFAVAEA